MKEHSQKLIAQNKKAYHEYFIEETFQAGIALSGTEVKSMRLGRCNLKESFIRIEGGSAFIEGMHISPYTHGNIFNSDPVRRRRLLLNRKEINKLRAGITQNGYTIVPIKAYFSRCYVKIDIALAKGKKLYDKREAIAKKTQDRDIQRQFAQRV
ncbi:MAG: SsrA-binding protein SmpB [Defluviitaleaceae bacterium]|nr:SsrA-binding protein SmpB [Defluviitaleaceae bacterium]MCL2261724.1 SsrA-binding protein SmpB [Defluviitaleaceae bacterium]